MGFRVFSGLEFADLGLRLLAWGGVWARGLLRFWLRVQG